MVQSLQIRLSNYAFLEPTSCFSIFRIKADEKKCISCGKCENVCPINVAVSINFQKKNATECILCMKYVHEICGGMSEKRFEAATWKNQSAAAQKFAAADGRRGWSINGQAAYTQNDRRSRLKWTIATGSSRLCAGRNQRVIFQQKSKKHSASLYNSSNSILTDCLEKRHRIVISSQEQQSK